MPPPPPPPRGTGVFLNINLKCIPHTLDGDFRFCRKRCEAVLGLENELIKFRGEIERLQHERDQDRSKIKVRFVPDHSAVLEVHVD